MQIAFFKLSLTTFSNQKRFNTMRFEFDTLLSDPVLPKRPVYVHEGKVGIVSSSVEAVVSKLPPRGTYIM